MQVIRVSVHWIIFINVFVCLFVCLSVCYMGYGVMSESFYLKNGEDRKKVQIQTWILWSQNDGENSEWGLKLNDTENA